jgi:predicted DNA-binding protein with PD1-like motif
MKHKRLHENDGQRTFAVVLETGDEVMSCLQRIAVSERMSAAQLTGIGAFSSVVLQYFDWHKKQYQPIPISEQVEVEVASLIIAEAPTGRPAVHIHLVVGKRDGSAMAGHLLRALVRPTLEVINTESPVHLRKRQDDESGLALIRPDA